ncbi:MAG: phosphomannomutase/phosphoglucomutase [Planctomycetota bacterium]
MNPLIFREYDIRGLVGTDLTDATVEDIGRGFGTWLRRRGRQTTCVGHDVRESSPAFAAALARGLVQTGCDVLMIGSVTTPILYWSILHTQRDGGVMVTGSHNPIEYNGLKACEGPLAIPADAIQDVRGLIECRDFETGDGRIEEADLAAEYRADIAGRFRLKEGMKVVVDAGNGAAGPHVVPVLESLGCQVVPLYCEPDGTFPNHLPDPEVPAYMQTLMDTVRSEGAALGLGFDGDADRVGVIDENGRKISADWILTLFARKLLEEHPGGTVIYDVKCTDFVPQDVEAHGGRAMMGRTGHSILKRNVEQNDAIIGGELSGHIVFGKEYYLIDDGLYAGLKVLQILSDSGQPLSALFADFPETFSTPEIKVPCGDAEKMHVIETLREQLAKDHDIDTLDGIRITFDEGWALVRASNTTANLTLRVEGRTEDAKVRYLDFLREELAPFDAVDITPIPTS